MSSSINSEGLALEDGSTRRGGVGSRGTGGETLNASDPTVLDLQLRSI